MADQDCYYKLSCGHLRLIKSKEKPVQNKVQKYCVQCEDVFPVTQRAERF